MKRQKYWLASNSPRRKEMLSWLGWDFTAAPADIDESRRPGEAARDYVTRLAAEKAERPVMDARGEDIIIAADTIVVLDEELIGKPEDENDARQILYQLRGRDHFVMTGIAVRRKSDNQLTQDICVSCVHMRDYAEKEIEEYIASGDPMDKAGAYAIQNPDFAPAEDFSGCYASVMGLPMCHMMRTLTALTGEAFPGDAEISKNHLKYNCPITKIVMAWEQYD